MNARTNIVLDNKLVQRAMKATGAKTKREVVDIALRRLVREETQATAQKNILDLVGADLIAADYDYKRVRGGR